MAANEFFNIGGGGDAESIQGISVTRDRPTDGDTLVYDAATNTYILSASAGGGGGGGAPTNAQYVTLTTNATLTGERVLTAGSGISITDNGAGSTVVIAATGGGGYPPDYASLTGSIFTGAVTASLGISGSHGSFGLAPAARGDVRLSNGYNGTAGIYAASSVPGTDYPVVRITPGDQIYIGAYESGSPSLYLFAPNAGTHFLQSQSTNRLTLSETVATFGVAVSASNGLSGSLQQVASGLSYLVAGTNVTITSASNGQVTIAASGGSATPGGSDTQLQYNNGGALGGIAGLTYSGAALTAALPVTASLGLSASFVQFGTPAAQTGLIRTKYNDGASMAIVSARDAYNSTNYAGVTYGPGHAWYFGHTSNDLRLDGLTTIVNGSSLSLRISDQAIINGISTSVTAVQPLTASAGLQTTHGKFGTAPYASQGAIRLPNNDSIYARNAADNADLAVATVNSSNQLILGTTTNGLTEVRGASSYLWGTTNAGIYNTNGSGYAILVDSTKITLGKPILSLTASNGISGSHVSVGPNAYGGLIGEGVYGHAKTWDYLTASTTTTTTPLQAFTFAGTSANKTYAVNALVTATSTTTTGSYYANWDAHYFVSGSSTILIPQQSPTKNKESRNSSSLSTALTSSAGNIVMFVTGTSETYRWSISARIQET